MSLKRKNYTQCTHISLTYSIFPIINSFLLLIYPIINSLLS